MKRLGYFSAELTLVYALMLGTVFVPNIFLKSPTNVAVVLLLVLFVFTAFNPGGRGILKQLLYILDKNKLGFLIFFSLVYFYSVELAHSILGGDKKLVLFGSLFFLVCVPFFMVYISRSYSLKNVLRGYVYFCLYMSVAGIVAFVLFALNLVDLHQWQYSLSELTDNPDAAPEVNLFPYYLGMITISNATFDMFGFALPRASGLASESSIAAFFVGPSLYLLNLVFAGRKVRGFVYAIIFTFMIVCASVTWIILFFILQLMVLVIRKKFDKVIIALILSSLVILVYVGTSGKTGQKDLFRDKFENSSSVGSVFSYGLGVFYTKEFFGSGLFRKGYTLENNTIGVLSYLVLYLHTGLVLILAFKNIFSRNEEVARSGLILLYLSLFMFRNLHAHYLWTPFYIFFLFYALYTPFLARFGHRLTTSYKESRLQFGTSPAI